MFIKEIETCGTWRISNLLLRPGYYEARKFYKPNYENKNASYISITGISVTALILTLNLKL